MSEKSEIEIEFLTMGSKTDMTSQTIFWVGELDDNASLS